MKKVLRSEDRGKTNIDWLKSYHSFSFGEYYDPENLHYGPLRVINDDIVSPGAGFPTHPHRDMEIITIVLEGTIEHKDSTGTSGQIKWGEVQKMSAGKGILHSEFNPSSNEYLSLLQIWIIPDTAGLTPSYEQKQFPFDEVGNKLIKVAAKEKEEDTIFIHQDATLYYGNYASGKKESVNIQPGRGVYIFNIEGVIEVNGELLQNKDAIMIDSEEIATINVEKESKFLLFNVAV